MIDISFFESEIVAEIQNDDIMNKYSCLFSVFFVLPVCFSWQSLADYVNPFIGATTNTITAKSYNELGKTSAGATTLFGMV